MRENGRVATSTSFSIFDSYDMKMCLNLVTKSFLASKWQDFKHRGCQFRFIKQLKNDHFKFKDLLF